MSSEGSSSIGGNSPVQTGFVGSVDSSETLKGQEAQGQFNSASLTRHPPQKHMPDVPVERHEFKPLHQWEVEVSTFENDYSHIVQQLQIPLKDTQDNRRALRVLINSAITTGHQVIAQYQARLHEQMQQGLMDSDTISQISEALQQDAANAASKLSELDQQLSSPTPKWQFRKKNLVLPDVQESLRTFNNALQRTKNEIRASSQEDTSQPSKWGEIGTQLEVLQIQLNNKLSNIQELKTRLNQGKQLVEQLITESSQVMSHAADNEQLQLDMSAQQQKLAEHLELLQSIELKGGLFSSVESQKGQIQTQLQGAIDIARQLQTWMPAIVTTTSSQKTAAPLSLTNPTLQQLASELKTAANSEVQEVALDNIGQFISKQQKEYEKLIPLLSLATIKQDGLGGNLVPEVSDCLTELNALANTITRLRQAGNKEEYSEILQKADKALTYLEDFNSNMPSQVYYLLTESLSEDPTETEHFNNLLCRSALTEPPQRLSEKKHLSVLTAMHEYQIQLSRPPSETDDQKNFLAHRSLVNEAFTSPEWVRTITEQARNLEELRALSHVVKNWAELQHELLVETCTNLEKLKADMQMPKIVDGRQAISQMTVLFDDSIQQYTDSVEAVRRAQLQRFTHQAIEEHISHRLSNPKLRDLFKSTEALCKNLQEELNQVLDGLAKVTLVPAQNEESGSIEHSIEMQMNDPQQTAQAFNRLMRSKHAIAKSLAKTIPTNVQEPLLDFDPVQKIHTFVPHPSSEVQECGKAFADAFDTYAQAVPEAEEHKERIQRHADVRQKAEGKVDGVIQTIPKGGLPKQKKTSRQDATTKLQKMDSDFQDVKSASMNKMAKEATECRDTVATMLGQQQITASQAENMLSSLFSLLHTLDGRYTAPQAVMPEGITMAPPSELMIEINKLEKPPKAAFLLKIFAKERMDAYEHTKPLLAYTKSLISICSKSHEMPLQAIKMLDELSKILQDEGLQQLGEQVKLYSDDLYLKLRQITVEQEFPEPPPESRDDS